MLTSSLTHPWNILSQLVNEYVNDDYVNDKYVNDEYVNDEYVNEYVNEYVDEYVNECGGLPSNMRRVMTKIHVFLFFYGFVRILGLIPHIWLPQCL